MRTLAARSAPGQRSVVIPIDGGRLTVTARGENGAGEAMFHLSRTIEDGEIVDLQEAFGLTRREAEVLLWISRGKANRDRSEEHTSELQSLMRRSYAVFRLKKKRENNRENNTSTG